MLHPHHWGMALPKQLALLVQISDTDPQLGPSRSPGHPKVEPRPVLCLLRGAVAVGEGSQLEGLEAIL